METKYYVGNFVLGMGQPFVVLSVEEMDETFRVEKLILFKGFNEQTFQLSQRYKYPNILNRTLDDFIDYEILQCKDLIFYSILYKNFKSIMEEFKYNISIELKENDSQIVWLLNRKFPKQMESLKLKTTNIDLKRTIEQFQSASEEWDNFEL